ncbi:hypothetical protein MAR_035065 [Mya arenaria]|uniref:Uncharacterized protein n=1 Tax=Mya arenaria TaxID=6604 RepID=A0ABY7ELJ3_MYAAR|nr:hypothetical protein MAR_035065 [Mya arenaria]
MVSNDKLLIYVDADLKSRFMKSESYTVDMVAPQYIRLDVDFQNLYQKNQSYKIEIVQRRTVRYALNRFHYTRSGNSILNEFCWETPKSGMVKLQLTGSKSTTILLITLINGQHPRQDQSTSSASTYHLRINSSSASRGLYSSGMDNQPQWPRLPPWYFSRGSSPPSPSNGDRQQLKDPSQVLSCADGYSSMASPCKSERLIFQSHCCGVTKSLKYNNIFKIIVLIGV